MRAAWLVMIGLLACGQAARAEDCSGVFVRNAQAVQFGAVRPALKVAGPVMRKGASLVFVGVSTIGRKTYYYQYQSANMFDAAAVRLKPGCRLDTLDTSEPD